MQQVGGLFRSFWISYGTILLISVISLSSNDAACIEI